MKVLITGGTGLLGSQLLRSAPDGVQLFATYHTNLLLPQVENTDFSQLEITDAIAVRKLMKQIRPDVVIHTAAKSSPDFCEKFPEDAWKINVQGTRNVMKYGSDIGAKVFIMTSNHVFSGKNPPYKESSQRDPVNRYGKTKLQNEEDAMHGRYNATVLRLMTMYGWGNPAGQKNTAMWVIDMLSSEKSIKVVDDVYNNFLWVGQAADIIWRLVNEKRRMKLLQIAGAEVADRYTFAKKVANVFSLDTSLLSAVPKSFFQDEAPRPLNTIYDTKQVEKIILPDNLFNLMEGLKAMKKFQPTTTWVTKDL